MLAREKSGKKFLPDLEGGPWSPVLSRPFREKTEPPGDGSMCTRIANAGSAQQMTPSPGRVGESRREIPSDAWDLLPCQNDGGVKKDLR